MIAFSRDDDLRKWWKEVSRSGVAAMKNEIIVVLPNGHMIRVNELSYGEQVILFGDLSKKINKAFLEVIIAIRKLAEEICNCEELKAIICEAEQTERYDAARCRWLVDSQAYRNSPPSPSPKTIVGRWPSGFT